MSKSSTATAPKNPPPLSAKSAWARGPPQAATAPSPRSQSPAPATPTHQTHSRRPSTLGQGVPIKDGVSVPRSNVGAVKQGSAVTFGSIDDVSAPISSSPAAAPSIKSEGVKSFGTVPAASAAGHVNGKASISSRTSVVPPAASSSSSAASTPPVTAPAATAKPKIDIKKMFQNPSSAPSSTPSSDSSSPSMRNVPLPSQQSSSHQGQSTHPPSSQLAHSYTPFVPSGQMRPPQNSGPNGGPPRSPQYSRQMPNGNGPRSQGGQNGGPSAGLSSPRLGPHPHNGQSSPMPPPPPQMQPQMHQHMGMPWPGYYQPYTPDPQHYMYPQWYPPPPMPMQPTHAQHQHQPPNQHIPPHTGMPMSPRNPPSSLQGPGTPTLSHALPTPVHAPHPPPPALSHPSNSIVGLTSNLSKSNPTPASIRIESEDQRKLRLAEEEQKEKEKARVKAEAEEKARKEKEEAERKIKKKKKKKKKAKNPPPLVDGKTSISSRASVVPPAASSSSSAASTPPVTAVAAATAKPKIDIKKMFQNPSSAPSSTPSSGTSSPMRNVPLPWQQSSHQGQSTYASSFHSYTPFVPSGQIGPPQNISPNGGPPRSPQYSRQMSNGNGLCLSSPRLGPHPHNGQSSPMPPPLQMQPQMHQPVGMPWPGYCEDFLTQDDFRTLGTRKKNKIKKNNDIQLVSDFLHRAVSSGMCSTVLLGQSESQTIADIVQGFATDSPNAFASLALMVKGAGLSDGRD